MVVNFDAIFLRKEMNSSSLFGDDDDDGERDAVDDDDSIDVESSVDIKATLSSISGKSKVGDKVLIIKIDVDKNPGVAMAYKVQSVPTLILFKNGNVLWRQSGVMMTEQLKKVIDQHS